MANPRTPSWNNLHPESTGYPVDNTIVVPTAGPNGLSPALPAQLGFACTLVNTGTQAPKVGLGAAGGVLLGKVVAVDLNGMATVQEHGTMYFPYVTGASQPVPGQPVAVDGTGKIEKVALGAAAGAAICLGFDTARDTLTAALDGTVQCVVRIP